jgi:hypothetical protein
MSLLLKFLFKAARRVASDERVQRATADTYRNQVKPRADAAWQKAQPRIEETKADIGRIAEETDARNHPARFAGKATRRLLNELKPKSRKD